MFILLGIFLLGSLQLLTFCVPGVWCPRYPISPCSYFPSLSVFPAPPFSWSHITAGCSNLISFGFLYSQSAMFLGSYVSRFWCSPSPMYLRSNAFRFPISQVFIRPVFHLSQYWKVPRIWKWNSRHAKCGLRTILYKQCVVPEILWDNRPGLDFLGIQIRSCIILCSNGLFGWKTAALRNLDDV